ncbi:hypothetical protein SeLEV6574_g02631 [Synchytrium endobioticum]|uniref:Uncharacterized protein n=1 Tax=Synchytrium endobioticum TaxID=286115 RepID=A0A507D7S3_9FUNG|nr:hypothetical protein SeLEV6574_g02622 [Synchytrium endobioticum]TPX47506.1 hypothetical protein SeLEV6574_g02631 [Synchytrium endobioticum]
MYPHNLLKVMPPVDHCPRLSSRHQLMDPRDCPDVYQMLESLNALVTERERSAAFDRNYQGIADMVCVSDARISPELDFAGRPFELALQSVFPRYKLSANSAGRPCPGFGGRSKSVETP